MAYEKYMNDPTYGLQAYLDSLGQGQTFGGIDPENGLRIMQGDDGGALGGNSLGSLMENYNPQSAYEQAMAQQGQIVFGDGMDALELGAKEAGISVEDYVRRYQGDGTWSTDQYGNRVFAPTSGQIASFPQPNVQDGIMNNPFLGTVLAAAGGIFGPQLYGGLQGMLGGGEFISNAGLIPAATDFGVSSIVGTPMAATEGAALLGGGGSTVGAMGGGAAGAINGLTGSQLLSGLGTASSLAGLGEGGGSDMGINAGGLDGPLGDSAANYTGGMGGSNPLTTAGTGGLSIDSLLGLLGNKNLLTSLLGAGTQGLSSYFASQAQQDAANQANNTLRYMYDTNRADLAPWRDAGKTAVGQLTDLTTPGKQFDTMNLDPGYQFRLSEGQNAIDNKLRAAGKFYSGSALKGAADYNQNFASNEFGNVYNRLAGLAGTGQAATNTTAQLGSQTAQGIAGNQLGEGNARASGYMGVGGAVNQGINSYNSANQFNQMLELLKTSKLFG